MEPGCHRLLTMSQDLSLFAQQVIITHKTFHFIDDMFTVVETAVSDLRRHGFYLRFTHQISVRHFHFCSSQFFMQENTTPDNVKDLVIR